MSSSKPSKKFPSSSVRATAVLNLRNLALLSSLVLAYVMYPITSSKVLGNTYALCTHGQNIYTVDAFNSRAECVVVRDSIFVDVGSLVQVRERWKSLLTPLPVRYTEKEAIVVPGLSDAHAHILEYGGGRQLYLEGIRNIQETVTRIRDYILSNEDIAGNKSTVIFGGGWDHTMWPDQAWPTSADLDSDPIIKQYSVILQSKDCHALWVSAQALALSLPLPDSVPGGVILRDASGNPTGTLLDNAQDLLMSKMPPLTQEELKRRFMVTVKDAVSVGLTSIHDAGFDPISLRFFTKEAEREDLPIRIYGMRYFDESVAYWGNTTTPIISLGRTRLGARSVKIFADGALRTGGSALYEPYNDAPETKGFMRISEEALHDVIPKFLRDGWQVNVHAIGDLANGIVLDVFEKASKTLDLRALRPRLEHAQLMTQADMKRLGQLGVIASVQPSHIADMWYAEGRIGDRVKGLYAFRSILDSGARLALGSDFPVESMNPLHSFHAAVTRLTLNGDSPHGSGGWFPEQRLTRQEALRGMTIDPAYASFRESELGSIEVGKRADYVVLSQDIMTVPQDQIIYTKVFTTVIDGKHAYQRSL